MVDDGSNDILGTAPVVETVNKVEVNVDSKSVIPIEVVAKPKNIYKTIFGVFTIILLAAAIFVSGILLANRSNLEDFSIVMNNTISGYNKNLESTARNYYEYGYIAAVNGVFKYGANCSVISLRDPLTNGTMQLQDVTC